MACAAIALSAPSQGAKSCVCKANGRDYHEGQIACILGRLARCEMFLNNTTWKQLANDCPEASLLRTEPLLDRLRLMNGSLPPKAC